MRRAAGAVRLTWKLNGILYWDSFSSVQLLHVQCGNNASVGTFLLSTIIICASFSCEMRFFLCPANCYITRGSNKKVAVASAGAEAAIR